MIYTDGTITIKAGSPIVTGTGTQWKKNIHGVAPGQMVSIENGANPVNMMIRAVNSDTELVLSFNAPVARSGAKYSIATTVPDTISDAARTMSANQGYIVYFLQAMQQWMTDTGQVEIELPNGQKVTLDSVKALNEAIAKIPKVVQETGDSKTDVMSQAATKGWIGAAIGFNSDGGTEIYPRPNNKAGFWQKINDGGYEVWNGRTIKERINDRTVNLGVDVEVQANYQGAGSSKIEVKSADAQKSIGMWAYNDGRCLLSAKGSGGSWNNVSIHDAGSGIAATREWIKNNTGWSVAGGTTPMINSFQAHDVPSGQYRYIANNTTGIPANVATYGDCITARYDNSIIQHIIIPNYGDTYLAVKRFNGGSWEQATLLSSNMYIIDGSGFYKKSSPIIQIHPNGSFETNDESEGTEVHRTDTGQYHITGILGYNSDGAWGVNGGISVPKDNNGLELVYVADRVLEDGGIIVETCHRQHTHLPDKFQNWRLKEITTTGDRVFYQDGEPCDLPEYTRLDVRVEMPQGSVWNVKQRELAERMEREQGEREAQEAAEQAGEVEE